MNKIHLRPAEPERDFELLAGWFSILENEMNTEASLKEYYTKAKDRIVQKVAVDEEGQVTGFYWAGRERVVTERAVISLYVRPDRRRQGTGGMLYQDMEQAMREGQVRVIRSSIDDSDREARAFALRRGFVEQSHSMMMALDLEKFDDRPYGQLIARLEGEGFMFTSMEAQGNTEEAQRKLYRLNETTGMEIPGTDGNPSWTSFENFQQSVCHAEWYKPSGQMVVIDKKSGEWVAMSAITRFEDYAYNLHTGVDKGYRGRKLGQAVKALALRYACESLGVSTVRTHHNQKNLPMIAIDKKFGYVRVSAKVMMDKSLES